MAAWMGRAPVVAALLAAAAAPDARDWAAKTPLHLAARNGHTDVLAALLTAGAASEAVDVHGHTPAALAAAEGHSSALRRAQELARAPRL